jgi:hypothetical protein
MNRKTIIDAVEQAATARGYNFYSDEAENVRTIIKRLPALCLTPPKFLSMQGRRHGKITYEVTLHAIRNGIKCSPDQKDAIWAELEQHLLDIFSLVSQNEKVAAINDLTIDCTSHGKVLVGGVEATAKARVETLF